MQPLRVADDSAAVRAAPGRPFLGPIPFSEADSDLFFGREDDVVRLRSLLRTERIVVLHSPSGAGKTSLIQAGLIPRLRKEDGFRIFPVVRVGQPLPDPRRAPASANRFAYGAIYSLEAGFAADGPPAGGYQAAEELIGIRLSTYFEHRSAVHAEGPRARLLIFDQFEELFTRAPHDHRQRIDFFTDLAKVLHDRTVWALFVMRQEHVAALDRYKRLLPAQLAARFHLDLLTPVGAREAIERPLARKGVEIQPEALGAVLADLARRVSEPGMDAGGDDRPEPDAPVIDPLHLQLACVELWDRLPAGARSVEAKMVCRKQQAAAGPHAGDLSAVEWALLNYYDQTLRRVCERALDSHPNSGVAGTGEGDAPELEAAARRRELERRVRYWIDDQLIERDRYRRQEMAAQKDPLLRRVQELLEDEHILGANVRLGITWYEIAHDRLVASIRRSNEAWAECHHNRFERNARRWRRQGFPRQFEVLTPRELEQEGYGRAPGAVAGEKLPDHERRYLDYCLEQERKKRWKIALAVLMMVAVIAGALAISPFFLTKLSDREARIRELEAREESLAGQIDAKQGELNRLGEQESLVRKNSLVQHLYSQAMTQRWRAENHDVALLLAKLAAETDPRNGDEPAENSALDTMFWTALEAEPFSQTVPPEVLGGKATSLAAAEHVVHVAVAEAGEGDTPRIDVAAHRLTFEPPCRRGVQAFSPDRSLTAAVGGNRLDVLAVGDGRCRLQESKASSGSTFRAQVPAWSSNGRYVSALLENGEAAVYRIGSGREADLPIPRRDAAEIAAVAFGDGVVAAGDHDGGIQFFDLADGRAMEIGFSVWEVASWPDPPAIGHPDPLREDAEVLALAFLPPLSVADGDRTAATFDLHDERGWLCVVHRGGLRMRGGRIFLYGLSDPRRRWYELVADESSEIREQVLRELGRHDDRQAGEAFASARFSADGRWLVTGGEDGTVVRWDLGTLELGSPIEPDRDGGATGSGEALHVFKARRDVLRGAKAKVQEVEIIDDGRHVAAIERDGGVRLWHLQRPSPAYRAERWHSNEFVYDLAFEAEDRLISADNQGHLQGWQVISAAEEPCASSRRDGGLELCIVADPAFKVHLTANRGVTVSIRSLAAAQGLVVLSTSDYIPRVLTVVDPARVVPLRDTKAKHHGGLWSAALRPQNPGLGKRYDVATGDATGTLLLWDLVVRSDGSIETGEPAVELKLGEEAITGLAFHPDGRWLAAASQDGNLRLIDADGESCADPADPAKVEEPAPCLARASVVSLDGINALAFSPGGDRLATAGGRVGLWNFNADPTEPPFELDPIQPLGVKGPVLAIGFHPANGQVLAATEGSSVLLWRLDHLERPTRLQSEGTVLHSVAFSPQGRFLAAGDERGRLMVWDIEPANFACHLALRNLTRQEWKDLGLAAFEWRRICPDLPAD